MTGSIACYKACSAISKLVQNGHQVQVVGSPNVTHFVGNSTIEGLTGKPLLTDLYQTGENMSHIHLDRWADIVVAAPATANFINKISKGLGDDLISTLFLAHDFKKPYLIAPAMNSSMYNHPATQDSIAQLKKMGVTIFEAENGSLACGEEGPGRLLDPNLLVEKIENHKVEKIGRILVTAGGTSEPIDAVRVFTNKSTGQTGIKIAESFLEAGFEVDLLHAEHLTPQINCNLTSFSSFSDYQSKIHKLVQDYSYTAIIHAAAISDFSIESVNGETSSIMLTRKLRSDLDLEVKFKKNPKIIDNLLSLARGNPILIGFKMTSEASQPDVNEAIDHLLKSANCTYVVHNDTKNFSWGSKTHPYYLYCNKNTPQSLPNKDSLGIELVRLVKEHQI